MSNSQHARAGGRILQQGICLSLVCVVSLQTIVPIVPVILDEESCIFLFQHPVCCDVWAQPARTPLLGRIHREVPKELSDVLTGHQDLRKPGQQLHFSIAPVQSSGSALPPPEGRIGEVARSTKKPGWMRGCRQSSEALPWIHTQPLSNKASSRMWTLHRSTSLLRCKPFRRRFTKMGGCRRRRLPHHTDFNPTLETSSFQLTS